MQHNNKLPKLSKGFYRHNKTGTIYEVIGVALHTETDELMVVYRVNKPNPEKQTIYEFFTRPYEMFSEIVTINGQKMPRFEKVALPRTFIA